MYNNHYAETDLCDGSETGSLGQIGAIEYDYRTAPRIKDVTTAKQGELQYCTHNVVMFNFIMYLT